MKVAKVFSETDHLTSNRARKAGLVRLMKALVSEDGLRELLAAFVASETSIGALASRSCVHENGFVKLPLLKSEGLSVRLHVWHRPETSGWIGNIHDHRYSFFSHVLSGRLIQRTWSGAGSGATYLRFRYVPRKESVEYALQYDGEQVLAAVDADTLVKGTTYHVPSGTLHQTRVESVGRTMTLIVEDRANLRPYALVYSRRYERRTKSLRPSTIGIAACYELLVEAQAKLT